MNFFKKHWPHFVYLAIVLFMFRNFIFSDNFLFGSDTAASGIFFRTMYADFVKQYWEMPLWDRFICGGLPFVDATHGDTFYPTSILQFIMPMHRALGFKLVIHIFLAGSFMFIFLKNYGLRNLSAFWGGLAYLCAPTIVSLVYPGHDAKIYVAALLPLAFNFLHKGLTNHRIADFLYLGGVAGFMLLSSHIQTTYMSLWAIFFYAVFHWICEYRQNKQIGRIGKSFGLFWSAMLVALIIGAVQLIPPYIYAKQFSIRGTEAKTSFEHAISWGLHQEEALSMVVPQFCGENVTQHVQSQEEYAAIMKNGGNGYWGRNAFKFNSEYAGLIPLVLLLLGLAFYKGQRKKEIWFFFGVALFSLLYGLVDHTPIFYLAYKIIPGVKMFRGQGMIMFIFAFSVISAAALYLDALLARESEESTDEKYNKKMLFAVIGLVVLTLISFGGFSGLMSLYQSIFTPPKMPDAEYLPFIRRGVMLAGLLAIITTGTVLAFLKKKIKAVHLIVILSLITFIDTYRVNALFIQPVSKAGMGTKFQPDQIMTELNNLGLKEEFRVLNVNLYGENELPNWKIQTIDGFHDNELKTHRMFRGINAEGVNTNENLMFNFQPGPDNTYSNNPFVNIAGGKFIFLKYQNGQPAILTNSNYLPRASIFSRYEVISDESKIADRIKDPSFDYRNTIILEKEPVIKPAADSVANGKVTRYEYIGNELFVDAEMTKDGLLFMSDNYFPYWHVYDQSGKELEIMKANLTFRAIALPAGKHQLSFKFVSQPYNIGKWLTIAGLLLVLGFGVGQVVRSRLKK